jgi:hypothetical protein
MWKRGKLIFKNAMQNQNAPSVIGPISLTYHPVLSLKFREALSIEAATLQAVVMSEMPANSTLPQCVDGECSC